MPRSIVPQIGKVLSYEKYSSDGVFDLDDGTDTAIEAGVAALYAPVEGIWDTASLLSGGGIPPMSEVVTKEDISDRLKNIGPNWGAHTQSVIENNPYLMDLYGKSEAHAVLVRLVAMQDILLRAGGIIDLLS